MKMHKRLMLALAPMILLAASVRGADDSRSDQFSDLNIDNIVDAEIAIDEFSLDDVDVDSLAASAEADKEEAIEACFRRMEYGNSYGPTYGTSWGYGSTYGSCYYPSYSYGYHWQTPCYTEYRPLYTYRTCYTTYQYTPVYTSYWGCY